LLISLKHLIWHCLLKLIKVKKQTYCLARRPLACINCTNRPLLLFGDFTEDIQTGTLLRLYQSMLTEHQVDFYGEPLEGLQVMGMLETRTLDFKRVIITSMNEGILPTGKSQNSFIPFDLKRGFGMPTYDEKDAIYAYHFYRLLQRAEEVWLIYDSDTQGVGLKEKSRFIFQVEQELAKEENITLLPTEHQNPEVKSESLVKLPEYAKDEAVLQRLKEMATYGFFSLGTCCLSARPRYVLCRSRAAR
jgi:hypothetical protein